MGDKPVSKKPNKISGLIHSSFFDVVNIIKNEYGWDLNYIKCKVHPMKDTQIKLVGNVLNVNPYFKQYFSRNGLEFDNLKKFFVLEISKELSYELYDRFWDNDMKKRWLNIINDDPDIPEVETLTDYFGVLVYWNLLGRLNAYGKEQPVD
jgi:hypothetical protein